MDRRFDPRSIVTPYAFAVHPDLVGRPLATPWQRLGAILVDLILIFILSNAIPGLLLALGSALLLFWLAVRKPGRDVFGKLFRIFVGCLGVIVLVVTVVVLVAIRYSDEIKLAIGEATQEGGIPPDSLTAEAGIGDVLQAIQEAGAPDTVSPVRPGGTAADISVISDSLARDSLAALSRLLTLEREAHRDAQARVASQASDEAEDGGPLAWLLGLVDNLGLGFGWGALYLTITHAWWKGTSIGKRLFRIRVVLIDQRPLNWWLSFERAGGYAAGFATGLLGFAQVFWDPNRQAIHDKVSETIVIQDGKPPVPGPWIEEGKAMWAGRRGESMEHQGGSAGSR